MPIPIGLVVKALATTSGVMPVPVPVTAHDHSDLGGLLFLTARQGVTRTEKALAKVPQD